jgi:phosphoglycerol transferase MdoB-like AlkP superfamily enzyme
LALIASAFIFVACFFLPDGSAKHTPAPRRMRLWTCGLLLVGLLLLGGEHALRGQISAAARSRDDSTLKQLAQNSTMTLLRSQSSCAARFIGTSAVLPPPEREEVLISGAAESATRLRGAGARDNIVIIIVERLSTEYTGIGGQSPGYTPFLTELAQTSLSFENHFANARRSIDALPSILLGLPRLSDATFRCAKSRRLEGLASILREHGYQTLFFHGGRNGAGDFDAFAQQTGFTRYYGADDYGRPADADGIWGIYDEPFFALRSRRVVHARPAVRRGHFYVEHTPAL